MASTSLPGRIPTALAVFVALGTMTCAHGNGPDNCSSQTTSESDDAPAESSAGDTDAPTEPSGEAMNNPGDTSTRADLLTSEGDWIKYGAGNPHFRGRTEVVIRQDGRVTVTFEQKPDLETYRGELSDKRLTELRNLLREHDPRDLPSDFERGEKGVPDEVVLTIEASVEGREVERKFWHNERHDHEGLKSLVISFEEIAGDISDGEVTY